MNVAKDKKKKWKFWCDRGGTFTDVVGVSPQGTIFTEKLLSDNVAHYKESTIEGIRRILDIDNDNKLPAHMIESVRMGTTIGTNALLENKGSSTALIITAGFKDALDYYEKSSSLQYLPSIIIPTLIINSLNDSFLSAECYPVKEAKQNPNLYLEMPKYGGHVGFIDKKNVYYNERRALDFVNQIISG